MAAPLLPLLRLWLSAYPGAKLFAYLSGTTTKTNTYSDASLTTPNANPVVSDGTTGLFGSIYLDPAIAYKFVLAPSTDTDPPTNPLFTQDNVTLRADQVFTVLSKTANYTVLVGDGDDVLILADATTGAMTVSLYTAVGNAGHKVRVVKIDSSANPVTIDPSGAQTANGVSALVLNGQWQSVSLAADGSNWVKFAGAQVEPLASSGRLTLTSGTPVTSTDVTAATSVYFTPYRGNQISLFDGTFWLRRAFSELSLSLAGLAADTNYDVFLYDVAGVLTLQAVAWTNATTRATALTLQNGVRVKSGATTYRYLGSFRTTGTIGQTEDSLAKRFLQNEAHPEPAAVKVFEGTDSWTYTTATWRQANGAAGNQIALLNANTDRPLSLRAKGLSGQSNSQVERYTGIGEDSTSAPSTSATTAGAGTPGQATTTAEYVAVPPLGYHYYAQLEYSEAAGTTTWYGDRGGTPVTQSGLQGSWYH